MGNKPYATEWLRFSYRNLSTAQKLFEEEHYTDIIGAEIQQCVEKSLKAFLAYHNSRIPRTHDLTLLASHIDDLSCEKPTFDDAMLDTLDRMTLYYKFERYPNPDYFLPDREEIEDALNLAHDFIILKRRSHYETNH